MLLQDLLGIELPIVQAPTAGAQGSALAIAVSNAPDYPHLFMISNQSFDICLIRCWLLKMHARAGIPKGFADFQSLDWLQRHRNRCNVSLVAPCNTLIDKT